MKRYWAECTATPVLGPMTPWVHRPADGNPWYKAERFEPPFEHVPGRGYPSYFVELDGFTFFFASIAELDVCIDTLSQRNLPDTRRETDELRTGPGAHWLNKLPGAVKSPKYRAKAVPYLKKARAAFKLGHPGPDP